MEKIDIRNKEMIIDWINSLPIKSCLIVCNINELYSGEIIIDILEYMISFMDKKDDLKDEINIIRISNYDEKINIIIKFLSKFTNVTNLIKSTKDDLIINCLLHVKNIFEKNNYFQKNFIKNKSSEIKTNKDNIQFVIKKTKTEFNKNIINSYCNNSTKDNINKHSEEIKNWLLEIKIPIAHKINLKKEILTEFKDGLLLNQIMCRIDFSYLNKVIIDPNPIFHSIGLINIKKILNYLKLNNKMPIELLASEKEIQKGNKEIILKLLLQLKKNYWMNNTTSIKFLKLIKNINILSTKYNNLKCKEKLFCEVKKGVIHKKVCEVNGTDHSISPFFPLNPKLRNVMFMNKKYFFN